MCLISFFTTLQKCHFMYNLKITTIKKKTINKQLTTLHNIHIGDFH